VADALAPQRGEDEWRRRTERKMRKANRRMDALTQKYEELMQQKGMSSSPMEVFLAPPSLQKKMDGELL